MSENKPVSSFKHLTVFAWTLRIAFILVWPDF